MRKGVTVDNRDRIGNDNRSQARTATKCGIADHRNRTWYADRRKKCAVVKRSSGNARDCEWHHNAQQGVASVEDVIAHVGN